jgi:hypothetical protein
MKIQEEKTLGEGHYPKPYKKIKKGYLQKKERERGRGRILD